MMTGRLFMMAATAYFVWTIGQTVASTFAQVAMVLR